MERMRGEIEAPAMHQRNFENRRGSFTFFGEQSSAFVVAA